MGPAVTARMTLANAATNERNDMTNEDARRHAAHLCDVYATLPNGREAFGVIDEISSRPGFGLHALVAGHPEYPDTWVPIRDLQTSCRVTD
jgi:hypothetical protein